jgi:hypothetical protein
MVLKTLSDFVKNELQEGDGQQCQK